MGPAAAAGASAALAAPIQSAPPYVPTFFNAREWAFLHAACDCLIPADDVGPGAVELGVPEFLDRHMQTPYAAGDLWYRAGPYREGAPEFGYQGRLSLREIIQVGIAATDRHCADRYEGAAFAALDPKRREEVLSGLEQGKVKLDGVPAKVFFASLLGEVRNGYFADPRHGGNRGMGSWKMIGYPGMRADYADWAEVRDRPYPLPPVDLAGRRA